MKKHLVLLALSLLFVMCTHKAVQRNGQTISSNDQAFEHYYILMDDCEVRDAPMIAQPSRRLKQAIAGDTLMSTYEIKDKSGWHSFVRDSFLVYMYSPLIRFSSTRAVAGKRVYKPIALATEWWVIESQKASRPSSDGRYSTPTTGATIHTGPRGGRYYYNSNGNKTYIRKK